ncbi:MAG: ABC transporter permease [Ignavibacteriales bacterium]|nr:ABC transporter permease [Ignavibacteriales bacterium]
MLEYFIAKKYLRSKHRLNFISVISIISTIGVTIGVAALIIVLSVFNGFGSLVTKMLINFDPHVRITSLTNNPDDLIEIEKYLAGSSDVKSFAPYAEGKVILMKKKSIEILNIKGIELNDSGSTNRIKTRLVYGEFDLTKENSIDKIILSRPIAMQLSVRVGDTIFATSANQLKKTITRMTIPQSKRLIISGIYEISNKQYALEYTFTSLECAQGLLNLKRNISGVEVILNDLDDSENLKEELLSKFTEEKIEVTTWYDMHKDLYRVMLLERWAAYILLSLIIAVAVFNILSSLTMSVFEKKKDIGVLRSMGVTGNSIKKIFMFEGILIGVLGTVIGLILGLLVCYLQINFNIYPLDASKFVIDTLPMEVRVSDIFAVSIMSLTLSYFASKYPANQALKTKIIDALKWE